MTLNHSQAVYVSWIVNTIHSVLFSWSESFMKPRQWKLANLRGQTFTHGIYLEGFFLNFFLLSGWVLRQCLRRLPALRSTHFSVSVATRCRSPAVSLSESSIILARLLLDLYCHYLNSWAQKFSLLSLCASPLLSYPEEGVDLMTSAHS